MQNPSKSKEQKSMHEELDQQIRHLLFLNPLLDINMILRQLDMLPSQLRNDKMAVVLHLTERREQFLQVAEREKDAMIRHLNNWKKKIGPFTIKDVTELLKGTSFKVNDIAPELITPKSLEEWLCSSLIGQPEYAQTLAFCFYLHNLRAANEDVMFPRSNLLIYGPSGVGKTYGPQKMADLFNFPFAVINCNSLVQEGIVGNSFGSTFTQLYMKHNENMEGAVILFDEFDKLFESGSYNERLLNELLNIIDDNNVITFHINDEPYHYNKITMKTDKMLFIFTGVFRGLENIVKKRLGAHTLGFANVSRGNIEENYHKQIIEEDFSKFFMRDELTGRIQLYSYARELKEDDLVNIMLHSMESPFTSYVNYFNQRDIELTITEDGARAIATLTMQKHLGVRGIKSLLLKILKEEMFYLNHQTIIVDKDYVEKKTA